MLGEAVHDQGVAPRLIRGPVADLDWRPVARTSGSRGRRRHQPILGGLDGYASAMSAWTEVGARVFVTRYRFYDQNIGVVLGDEAALVVDTRVSHRQAAEILAELRQINSLPVGVVVNPHGHSDHCFGNHPFRPATIWGHERCATMIETTGERQRQGKIAAIPELGCGL